MDADYNYPLTTSNQSGRANGVGLTDAPTYTRLTERWDGRDVAEDLTTTYSINESDWHWDGGFSTRKGIEIAVKRTRLHRRRKQSFVWTLPERSD